MPLSSRQFLQEYKQQVNNIYNYQVYKIVNDKNDNNSITRNNSFLNKSANLTFDHNKLFSTSVNNDIKQLEQMKAKNELELLNMLQNEVNKELLLKEAERKIQRQKEKFLQYQKELQQRAEEENRKKEKVEQERLKKQQEEEEQQEKQEFIEGCSTIDFDTLSRNPDKYKGNNYKLTGEIIQVQESAWGDTVDLRINITKEEFEYIDDVMWTDTIFATVEIPDGEDKLLEDDVITFWGTCDGNYTYETVLGNNVSLPKIDIKYYELNN